MISAVEARKLTNESDKQMKIFLTDIGKKVEEAARTGLCTLNLSVMFHSWDRFQCGAEPRISTGKPELTDFQKRLKELLTELGYSFGIIPYTYKDGCGLGYIDPEDYVEPEIKTGYHLVISW